MKFLKRLLIILFALYGLFCAFSIGKFNFLDGVDLLFHEAGHLLFGIFGNFPGILGGTLLQLLIPLIIFVQFLRTGQGYSASIILVWIAQNFFNIARYIQDARLQSLPLVGGGIHDWHFILSEIHMLPWDRQIAGGIWFIGAGLLALSVVLGFHYSNKNAGFLKPGTNARL